MSGYITKEEMDRRLNHPDNSADPLNPQVDYERVGKGRTDGALNVTPFHKEIIAAVAPLGSLREVGRAMGVSHGEVKVITGSKEGKKITQEVREKILDSALGVIKNAVGEITGEKLSKAKLTELSSVSKDMAAVIERIEGRDRGEQHGNTVVFYPVSRGADSYPILEAQAEVVND